MPVLVALVIGVVTGNVADTLAKGSKALKVVAVVIRAHDAAGNAVNVGRGVGDIRQNGLTVGNVLQVGAGGLAIAGDLGEVSEAAFKKLKIGAGELWVDELGAMGLPGDISTVRAAQRQADQVVAPKGKPLVRYGGPVTPEQLAEQAAAAAANPAYGVHGVSVILRNPPKGPHGQAAFEEAMKQFGIRQTGPNKSHYTVIIPENVTQEVADKFNALFNWFE